MGLKAFHLVFVTASILLCLGFFAWSLQGYQASGDTLRLGLGAGALAAAAFLAVYGGWFLRKLKGIGYL